MINIIQRSGCERDQIACPYIGGNVGRLLGTPLNKLASNIGCCSGQCQTAGGRHEKKNI